jgi:hypothetical protein
MTLDRRQIALAMLAAATTPFALSFNAAAQGSLLDQGKSLLGKQPGGGAPPGGGSSGGQGASLSQGEIGSGLKDALTVASRKVVGQVGKPDGYNGDPAIRIPLPGPLQSIEAPLKKVGGAGALDDLQLRMNRAAEQAAPKALDILTDAVSKMSISDARGILTGPKDSATQYFKRTSTGALTTAFRPIVDKSLSDVGAVQSYKAVETKASSLPLVGGKASGIDLTGFVVGKALDGLFHYIAVQEEAIRTNPAARTTDLLRKVFG